MTGRPFRREDYLAIKAAFRRDCEEAGTLEAIAERTRADRPLLSRYGNAERQEFPPFDIAMDVGMLGGGDRTLRAFAELRGYELVKDEPRQAAEGMHNHSAVILKEVAEAIGDMSGAIRRDPSPNMARSIHDNLQDVIDRARDAQAECRQVMCKSASVVDMPRQRGA